MYEDLQEALTKRFEGHYTTWPVLAVQEFCSELGYVAIAEYNPEADSAVFNNAPVSGWVFLKKPVEYLALYDLAGPYPTFVPSDQIEE